MVFDGEPLAKKSKAKGTLEELKAFAVEIGMPASDGENCFHKWESTGWKGIKDWKAKMQTWKHEGYHASQKHHAQHPAKPITAHLNTGTRREHIERVIS